MMPSTRKKISREAAVDATNLIDVVFVLLIFFVVTTTFNKELGVEISKPQASNSQKLDKQPLTIGVTRDGAIYVNERQVDMTVLRAILQRTAASDPEKSIVIHSDKITQMGVIVEILDETNGAGLRKVSVATSQGG